MIFNVDSLKPVLLIDISMNNYANIVFNKLLEYDKLLPDGQHNNYYIYMYKDYEHRFMKKFFRCVEATQKELGGEMSIEDISYDIMDSFEAHIKENLDKVENELEKFLDEDKNDPDNIFLLRKIQMNAIMLQMALKLNEIYNKKKESTITRLFELNTLMIGKVDDRKIKRKYSTAEFDKAVQELVNKVKTYRYERD